MDHSNAAGNVFGTKTKLFNCDLVLKLVLPDDHDPEEGCRFIVEYQKHRALRGEIVRSFTAWMEENPVTLANILGGTTWGSSWTTDARQKEVWELSLSHKSVREIAKEVGVPKSTVARWIAAGKRLGEC